MPQSVAVAGVDPHQQMTEMMFGYCSGPGCDALQC
jgi:hypothetical protein